MNQEYRQKSLLPERGLALSLRGHGYVDSKSQWPDPKEGFCVVLGLILIASLSSAQPLTNITFIAFDVETTGFSAESDRIIEIGAVKFRNGKVLGKRSWLINPGIPIPETTQRIHGITDKMVKESPPFSKVFPEFARFIKDTMLLTHNARFDIRFISAELQRNKMSAPENIVIDTLGLARGWFPDAGSYSLENLVKHLGMPAGRFHRALADSEHVTALFLAGVKKLPPNATLEDLIKTAGGPLKFGFNHEKREIRERF